MKGLRLYKIEKLRAATAIERLFALRGAAAEGSGVGSAMAYPWRAVWRVDDHRPPSPARFLITVPKKRLRHAVDRVAMRRRCREAYRLSRHLLPEQSSLDIAFIYVADTLTPYDRTAASMTRLLRRMASGMAPRTAAAEPGADPSTPPVSGDEAGR